MASKAQWTILTYIAAHNNLEQLGQRSLNQIRRVGSTCDVIHGVLYDGPQGATRYIVDSPGKFLIEEPLADFDSGDPIRLIETAQWVFEQCPAERYGLILWSHGTGWQPAEIRAVASQARGASHMDQKEAIERSAASGSLALFRTTLAEIVKPDDRKERAILFDDGTGHSLDTLKLAKVTQTVQEMIGQPLDLLGMDACLMATLEVAYQVRNSVRYVVASEELVPGHSWPYDTIFGDLRAHPTWAPAELAVHVVQQYTDYYKAFPPKAGDVTMVALDLGAIDKLAIPVHNLAIGLLDDMDNQADLLWQVQQQAEQRESRDYTRKPNKFSYHLWDVGSVAARLLPITGNPAVQTAAQDVAQALKVGGPTVLAEGHDGAWFDGIGGVSVYMMPPKKQDRMSPYYAQLALTTDTAWHEMLCEYHAYYA
jgi:hypothetical protein